MRNFVHLEGKITKLSVNKLRDGGKVASFTVVCYNGANAEYPAYFNVSAFNLTKENLKAVKKAESDEGYVAINGYLRQERWEDDDGNTRYGWKIMATTVNPAFQPPARDDDDDDDDNRRRGKKGGKKNTRSRKNKKKGKGKKKKKSRDEDDDEDEDDDDDDDDDDDEDVPF